MNIDKLSKYVSVIASFSEEKKRGVSEGSTMAVAALLPTLYNLYQSGGYEAMLNSTEFSIAATALCVFVGRKIFKKMA